MTYTFLRRAAFLMMAATAGPTLASGVTFSGMLGDTTNTALVASDLRAAQFSDDLAKANNVALYALNVAADGWVGFASSGFAAGGTDPFFTLFRGLDSSTATVVTSNYAYALAVGGDFTQTEMLSAGDYTVAIGSFVNLSFAENLGSGFLADGFIGLGDPRFFGSGAYELTVTFKDAATVPEPSGIGLSLTAALAALCASRRRRFPTPHHQGR